VEQVAEEWEYTALVQLEWALVVEALAENQADLILELQEVFKPVKAENMGAVAPVDTTIPLVLVSLVV
jgi:hypothetical protein